MGPYRAGIDSGESMRIPVTEVVLEGMDGRTRRRPCAPGRDWPVWFAPDEDDLFTLDDDDSSGAGTGAEARPLVVLVVDDDRDVHEATVLALRDEKVAGRPLAFLHAYSGAEALVMMTERTGIDVLLLDVVMESEDAGLRVADAVRADARLKDVKIIIRTGQPGLAPVEAVTRERAIDAYLTKEKLTRTLLLEAIAGVLPDAPPASGGSTPQ
jgi:CheY-like chemotaxis protein